jgi:hypothetical protein
VSRLSGYAAQYVDQLDSIEINPLLVQPLGLYALDVLFRARVT